MVKEIKIHLSEDEYQQALTKKGSRTWREAILGSLGVDYEERQVGRPRTRPQVTKTPKGVEFRFDSVDKYSEYVKKTYKEK